ncbi:hypothetical protein AVEN_121289-1 [Araneus ventricosus]|uniref:Uncharacterized protein n=1 Tax=Araneus ventricosus TaxID=182803 RepID=A0A4Y2CM71_ARAVE|nr:hypothetical protein AVEN_121289-1 [Araneus ventricosus]
MTQNHAPCGTNCDVKHLPASVAIACSFTISRRCLLSTGRRSSTLRQQQHSPNGGLSGDAVMAWPPRSPYITPLDFYLWGYVKQHEYRERINDINPLKQRITYVIHSVTPDVLTHVWEELDYRLDVFWATNGAHLELR